MSPVKILLTGATGYIGGSVLSEILETTQDLKEKYSISVLIRGEEKVAVFQKLGVKTILFKSLDEAELLRQAASEHDVVIHTASGYHTASAKALVTGLGDRRKLMGEEVHYIHTTGTSDLGDHPITKTYLEDHIFSDKEDIFAYLKLRESKAVYQQRTTDIVAIETGASPGVQTHLIMSPTIYGVGSGLFNKISIQGPYLMRAALKEGQAFVIGNGAGVWDYVHIADLAKLYAILLRKILTGQKVPGGEQIMFSSTGRFSWREMSEGIANALHELGALKTANVKELDLQDAADKLFDGDALLTELALASNSRTTSDLARELGWKPVKTEQDFKNAFLEEAKVVLAEKQ